MIDRDQLRTVHGVDLPLHILEQDYVQALFLQELYRETESLVFKGGTYLKHVHGLDRFSEDLDFTRLREAPVVERLETATADLDRYGLEAELDQVDHRPHSILAPLRYTGPLYDGSDRSRGSIEIEISTRGDVIEDPVWERLFVPYPEARAVTARCLTIEEALAEKLRALSTRAQGRDLYDVWFVLQQGVAISQELFEAKMTAVDEAAILNLSLSAREWDRDLSILLEHPPEYPTVKQAVVDAVQAAGISVEDHSA